MKRMSWVAWWSLAWRGVVGALIGYWCWGLYLALFPPVERFGFKNLLARVLLGFIVSLPLLTFIGVVIGTVIQTLEAWTTKRIGSVVGVIIGGTIGGITGAAMFYWRYSPGQRRIEGMSKVSWSHFAMGVSIGLIAGLVVGFRKRRA